MGFDPDLANAHLAAIVDSSFDAIISKDLNSTILTWNAAAERLFGYTAEEAVGQSILMLIPTYLQAEETDIISRIRRGEGVPTFETTRRHKDGHLMTVSLTVSPIRDGSGRIVGASKIARDITETRENARRIETLLREVNHRVKNQFAVILSMVRETRKRSISPAAFEAGVRDRIMALARSHDLLVSADWSGADLESLVREQLLPFDHHGIARLKGPRLQLQSAAVQNLGMALHELATNAAKYGALAGEGGRLAVSWSVNDGQFAFEWQEQFAPAAADLQDDLHEGFGTIVLKRIAPQGLHGRSELVHEPGRVIWRVEAPLASIAYDKVRAGS